MTRTCWKLGTIFACLAGAFAPDGNVQAAIIRLKSEAIASSSVIQLADIADVFDANPKIVAALRHCTLMPAPAAGSETQVDFATIRSRLQTHGFQLTDLEFTGASRVLVESPPDPTTVRSAERTTNRRMRLPASSWQVSRAKQLLSQAVLAYLQTTNLGDVDVEVNLNAAFAPQVIEGRSSGYEIRGGQPPWDAWQPMTVRFLDRDKQLQSIQIQFRALSRPMIPIASNSIPAGHLIDRQDIDFRRAESADEVYPTVDELIGRETTRPIRRGQIIKEDFVRQVPLVRRGDIVTAIAQVGGIQVKRQLYARSDGALGERVQLSTLDRKETIEATVTAYHEATVLTPGVRPRVSTARNSVNTAGRRGLPIQQPAPQDIVRGQSRPRLLPTRAAVTNFGAEQSTRSTTIGKSIPTQRFR